MYRAQAIYTAEGQDLDPGLAHTPEPSLSLHVSPSHLTHCPYCHTPALTQHRYPLSLSGLRVLSELRGVSALLHHPLWVSQDQPVSSWPRTLPLTLPFARPSHRHLQTPGGCSGSGKPGPGHRHGPEADSLQWVWRYPGASEKGSL